jgi:hypothetical protein
MGNYDYEKQAWVINGKYIRCGHPESMKCTCYGRLHEGEETSRSKKTKLVMTSIGYRKVSDHD